MITVSAIELFLKSAEILSDGFDKIQLDTIDADGDLPSALSVYAVDEEYGESIDYEEIEDCTDAESLKLSITPDAIAPYPFTYQELTLTSHAFHNAIENCLTCLEDKSISAESRGQITSSLKSFEQYVKKLDGYLSEIFEKN